MRLINADAILKLSDLPTEEVNVPEWGGTVLVRGLTAEERDAWEVGMLDDEGAASEKGNKAKSRARALHNVRAKLLVRAFVNDEGERIFTDAHIAALGKKSGAALERCFAVAKRLSGIGVQEVESLLGNSEPNPSDAGN